MIFKENRLEIGLITLLNEASAFNIFPVHELHAVEIRDFVLLKAKNYIWSLPFQPHIET